MSVATPMSPTPATIPTNPEGIIASPGGGTPSVSQKRSVNKRARGESESPDVTARKKAKVESAVTPSTLPREKVNPKRPQKDQSNNASFAGETDLASQLDFSNGDLSQHSQGEVDAILKKGEETEVMLVNPGSQGPVLEVEDIELESQQTVQLETLGELDEEMTTPENVCSTGEASDQTEEATEETMTQEASSGVPTTTPNTSAANIIIDERSKDSELGDILLASFDASLDNSVEVPPVDVDRIAVKAVDFAPETSNEAAVDQAAASAATVAATSETVPAPAKKSGYCVVM